MKHLSILEGSRYRTLYPHLMIEMKIRMGHGSVKLLNGRSFSIYGLIKAVAFGKNILDVAHLMSVRITGPKALNKVGLWPESIEYKKNFSHA